MAKILVVDDKNLIRAMLRSLLERAQHTVFLANGLQSGMSIAIQETPDLIITDLEMPGGDGDEFIDQLHGYMDHVPPVIMITGDPGALSEERKKQLKAKGLVGIIEKPFDPPTLLTMIENALSPTPPST